MEGPVPIDTIQTYANCDAITIVWFGKPIKDCRGFALERRVKGQSGTTFIDTYVGFKGEKHSPHDKRPGTEWPVQRYVWSDYFVDPGDQVSYRAVPMVREDGKLDKAPQSEWSDWSDWEVLGTGQTKNFEAYFNRGIVPAQWLAHDKPTKDKLQKDIDTAGSKNRNFLSGKLRPALLDLLKSANSGGVEIYAALYELNDPELIAALKALGGRCNLLLGSGAYKGADKKHNKPAEPDENAAVRKDLRLHSSINLHDRLVKSPHFAHNKFVVFCDKKGAPATVWTGSTNWTETGLCTQVNNGIHILSATIADGYRRRWDVLKDAGANYPANVSTDASTLTKDQIGKVSITAWNAPVTALKDLAYANALIKNCGKGVLFLMFNPGPKNTLLNTILALDPEKKFVHGVVNQDPGGSKAPLIKLTHKGKQLPAKSLEAILPAGLQKAGNWFDKTFTFNRVMIHSKVVVVDPFGPKPVVMTGSHNLGPKASGKNDDNLVIIENAPGLATEYAVNILGVYGHYKWLYNLSLRTTTGPKTGVKSAPQYDGNFDDDKWQDWYQTGENRREIDFWLGK